MCGKFEESVSNPTQEVQRRCRMEGLAVNPINRSVIAFTCVAEDNQTPETMLIIVERGKTSGINTR